MQSLSLGEILFRYVQKVCLINYSLVLRYCIFSIIYRNINAKGEIICYVELHSVQYGTVPYASKNCPDRSIDVEEIDLDVNSTGIQNLTSGS